MEHKTITRAFSPTTAINDNFNVETRGTLVGDSRYSQRQHEYERHGWSRSRDYDSKLGKSPTNSYMENRIVNQMAPNEIGFFPKKLLSNSTDASSNMPIYNTESDISHDIRASNETDDIYFQNLMENSRKEVHAASSAIDTLGFNFTQDIKGISQQLTSVLQNNHAHFAKYHLQHPIDPNYDTNVQRKNDMIKSLTEMLQKERTLNETQRDLRESTIDRILNNTEIFKTHAAQKHYKCAIMRLVFSLMRSNVVRNLKAKYASLDEERTEEIHRKLSFKHKEDLDKLNAEIASLKMQQANERAEYEAAIQEGLMRGLRSLNNEAFKVMQLKVSSGQLESDNINNKSSEKFYDVGGPSQSPIEIQSESYFEAQTSLGTFQEAKVSLGKFQEARSSLSKFQNALMQDIPVSHMPPNPESAESGDLETRNNNSAAPSPRMNNRRKQITKIINSCKKSSVVNNQKPLSD